MKINIPTNKQRVKDNACRDKALAFYLKKKSAIGLNKNKYDIVIEDNLVYYPYWIGTVHTVKARALAIYPDKKKNFYIVCDAIEGSFIVLQNVPKQKEVDVLPENVLQEIITVDDMKTRIFEQAVSDRINRQFIFGPPQTKVGVVRMIYLPMTEIKIREKGFETFVSYFVNIYTGEVKKD